MRTFALESASAEVAQRLDQAKDGRTLVTRNGQPYALIVRLEHKDGENMRPEASPEF